MIGLKFSSWLISEAPAPSVNSAKVVWQDAKNFAKMGKIPQLAEPASQIALNKSHCQSS